MNVRQLHTLLIGLFILLACAIVYRAKSKVLKTRDLVGAEVEEQEEAIQNLVEVQRAAKTRLYNSKQFKCSETVEMNGTDSLRAVEMEARHRHQMRLEVSGTKEELHQLRMTRLRRANEHDVEFQQTINGMNEYAMEYTINVSNDCLDAQEKNTENVYRHLSEVVSTTYDQMENSCNTLKELRDELKERREDRRKS